MDVFKHGLFLFSFSSSLVLWVGDLLQMLIKEEHIFLCTFPPKGLWCMWYYIQREH